MERLEANINGATINTRHFIATVDAQNRTFTIYGDFADTEIVKLGGMQDAIGGLIDELVDLESMLRRMAGMEGG